MASLAAALAAGDLAQLAAALRAPDADVNATLDAATGATALHVAAEQGDAAATHFLVLSKADVAWRRADGATPLHLAARAGHTTVCRLLVNGGAAVAAEDAAGQTPLHLACLHKWPAVVKLLIIEGGDVGKVNAAGQTPMALVVADVGDDEDAATRRQDTFNAIREADNLRNQLEADSPLLGDRSRTLAVSNQRPRRVPTRAASQQADFRAKVKAGRSTSIDDTAAATAQQQRLQQTVERASPTPRRFTARSESLAGLAPSPTPAVPRLVLQQTLSDSKIISVPHSPSNERRGSKSDTLSSWSVDDMKFGEMQLGALSRKQRMVLIRLAERRITELLGEEVILDLIQVPNTGSKPKFYRREQIITNQNYKGVLGVPLPVVLKATSTPYMLDSGVVVRVPFIVQQCLNFLNSEGIKTDGIFRKPGNSRRMTDLQNIFDGKPTRDVSLKEYTVHDVAGLLKRFVRELPEPIFTARLQNLFFAAMDLPDPSRRLICLQLLILIMPAHNRDLLQALLFFLHKVHMHADLPDGSKMNSSNLALVFAPNMARHLDSLDKPAAAIDIQQEQTDSAHTQELVQTLIDNCHELYRFQTQKANELPLSRKSATGSRARTLTNSSSSSSSPPSNPPVFPRTLGQPSPLSVLATLPAINSIDELEDEYLDDGSDDDDDDDPAAATPATESMPTLATATPALSLNAQFLADPTGSAWPEIMANLETRMERRIRRISERVEPEDRSLSLSSAPSSGVQLRRARGRLQSDGSLSTTPAAPSPLRIASGHDAGKSAVARNVSEDTVDSVSSQEDNGTEEKSKAQTFAAPASPSAEIAVFHGPNLNDEIARQYLKDFKKSREFIFGDIRKKDARKIVTSEKDLRRMSIGDKLPDKSATARTTKSTASSPLVPQTPDASVVALLDDLEHMSLEDLLKRMKEPKTGVQVKDRRRGFRLHKGVFVGREAIDWLVAHALSDERTISRRQATMLGRELLEMGAIAHVTESHGFKDENALYRFATDMERMAKAAAAVAASHFKTA